MSPFHSGMNHWQRQWLSDRLHKKHSAPAISTPVAAKPIIYWYRRSDLVKNAFLYNCRDSDLEAQAGARIEKGEIVLGMVGLVIAEEAVPGFSGKKVVFESNRRCEWQGFELPCMVHPNVPCKALSKSALRPFNYAVAELSDEQATSEASQLGVPVIQSFEGRKLINIELSSFEKQGKSSPRRAKLL